MAAGACEKCYRGRYKELRSPGSGATEQSASQVREEVPVSRYLKDKPRWPHRGWEGHPRQ